MKNVTNKNLITYGVIAFSVMSLMVFVVLPQLPEVSNDSNGLSTSVSEAEAWGSSCGSCEGGGGGEGGNGGEDNGIPVPAACNYLTASPTTLPYGGGTVTLSWSVSNATSASIDNGVGALSVTGSSGMLDNTSIGGGGNSLYVETGTVNVTVTSNTTFTLTASGNGGSDNCTVSVTVNPPPVTPTAVCNYLTASPTTLPHGGGNVTLSWSTTNANNVGISNVGAVSTSGSQTVFVSSNTTFTLTAYGVNGDTNNCAVSITVNPPVSTPSAVCDSFTADRTTVPYDGATVVLTWATTNATSVSIDNGVGSVSADGSKNVFVNSTVTYTLTAVGAGGNDTCTVTITKGSSPQAPVCNYLRVSDDEVEEGDDVTLTWSTTNATSASINQGIGNVPTNGSKTVEIDDDITFTLTVNGTNGSDTCTVRVEIEDEDDDDNRKTPRCELDISKDRVKRGEKVTLSWETTNVDEIVIKDDRGNTIFDTDDYSSSKRKKYFDGEIDVIINQSTEFRMTAEGEDGGRKTCKVDVEVDDIAVYEKRDQALVIALTQVPYTGFEAGAFLTFLFYAVLTLWALFIAYILVVKKGSVLGFSLYGQGVAMSETDVENRKKVEALVAKYAGQSWK